MRRRRRPPALALALAAFVWLSVAPPASGEDVVPLSPLGGGLVAVRLEIEGESLSLLLDTGTTRSWVRAAVARRLHLKPRARYTVQTTAGAVEGLCAGPVAARLGESDIAIECLGWSSVRDEALLPSGADGVLGADGLRGRPLLLDPARRRLVVDAAAREVSGTEVPLSLEGGRPALSLAVGGDWAPRGRRLRLVLDSAADHLVLFGEVASGAVPLRGAILRTLGGSRRVAVGEAPRLREVARPPRRAVLLADVTDRGEDGLLPLSAVGAVLLDWERGIAVLEARELR